MRKVLKAIGKSDKIDQYDFEARFKEKDKLNSGSVKRADFENIVFRFINEVKYRQIPGGVKQLIFSYLNLNDSILLN